jgi:predicted transcriptional regulator
VDGVYRYATTSGQDSVVQGAVASFVEKTLQGSVSPFVAFMSHKVDVSDQELAELEALVAQLQSRKREG